MSTVESGVEEFAQVNDKIIKTLRNLKNQNVLRDEDLDLPAYLEGQADIVALAYVYLDDVARSILARQLMECAVAALEEAIKETDAEKELANFVAEAWALVR